MDWQDQSTKSFGWSSLVLKNQEDLCQTHVAHWEERPCWGMANIYGTEEGAAKVWLAICTISAFA